jgi:hypothetical protein
MAKTTPACDCRIEVAEVARLLGHPADGLAERLRRDGVAVGPDWAGRASVTPADARAVVERVHREQQREAGP